MMTYHLLLLTIFVVLNVHLNSTKFYQRRRKNWMSIIFPNFCIVKINKLYFFGFLSKYTYQYIFFKCLSSCDFQWVKITKVFLKTLCFFLYLRNIHINVFLSLRVCVCRMKAANQTFIFSSISADFWNKKCQYLIQRADPTWS